MSLRVLFAPDAQVGVILLRRNKANLLIRWNTACDSFEEGQWLKGTVRPNTMDLSPDGRYLVFEASRYGRPPGTADTWTAVSRPPYWSALLFREGCYAGIGGGSFTDDGGLLLSDDKTTVGQIEDRGQGRRCPFEVQQVARPHRDVMRGWEALTAWPLLAQRMRVRSPHRLSTRANENAEIFRLEQWCGPDLYTGEGFREIVPWHQVTWADFDPNGRLVYAIGNTLHICGGGEESFALELGERQFRPLPPPDWALEW